MELYLKVGGAALIAASGVLAGLYAAREFARRVREIEAMIDCLNRMQAEIALRLTPMDEIFKTLASQDGPCAVFFDKLAAVLSGETDKALADLWQREAACLRPSKARDILAALGPSLGCFDAEQECGAIAYTVEQLKTELARAQEENATQGTLFKRLGAAAGVGAAILFL